MCENSKVNAITIQKPRFDLIIKSIENTLFPLFIILYERKNDEKNCEALYKKQSKSFNLFSSRDSLK